MAIALSGSLILSGSIIVSGSITSTGTVIMSGSIASASYALNATTGAYANTSTSASYALNATTFNGLASSIFATTGSNNFTAVQHIADTTNPTGFDSTGSLYSEGGLHLKKDAYISSSLYIKGNLTVYGTQSVSYITSSQLNISTNIITVNTATPSVRFGGIAVQDSGSAGGLTGSLLWDSQNNSWLYNNPSGSGNYDSSLVIMGPRNSSALGSEVGLNCNYLVQGHGHHHTTSSAIYHDGSTTCFYGQSYISSSGLANFASLNVNTGTCTPNFKMTLFGCSNTTSDGSNIYLNTTAPLIQLKTTDNTVGNIMGGIEVEGTTDTNTTWYAGGIYFKSACNTSTCIQSDIRFATRNASNYNDRMTIRYDGNVGIGTITPTSKFHVESSQTLNYIKSSTSTNYVEYQADNVTNALQIGVEGASGNRMGGTIAYNAYVGSYANYGLTFHTNNLNRVTITNTGITTFSCQICVKERVYLNGSFPGVTLDRAGTTAQSDIQWKDAGTSVWSIGTAVRAVGSSLDFYSYCTGDNVFKLTQTGTACFSGAVGIGTNPTSAKLTVCGNSTGGVPVVDIVSCGDGSFLRGVRMLNNAMTTVGSSIMYAVGYADNQYNMGQMYFQYAGNQSSANMLRFGLHSQDHMLNLVAAGCIYTKDLTFAIGSSGQGGATEYFRLDTNTGGSSTHYGAFIMNTRASAPAAGDVYMRFYGNSGTAGTITATGATSTAYNTSSDCRLKRNPQDLCGICILNQLKPKSFEWIISGCRNTGFYAQEVYEVLPEVVTVGVEGEGTNHMPWQMDNSKLIPVLTKALQEAICKINTLENCLGIN